MELEKCDSERCIESDLDYDPAVLRTVHAECISTHHESVGDSSESCSGVCIMVEHDFYLMSEWMCGP